MNTTITITRTGFNAFTVQSGEKFASMLGGDEALFAASCFVIKGGGFLPYLRDYTDWAATEKRYGGYVEPVGLLPAPENHHNASLAAARALAKEAIGVSCPLIRASYLERILRALGDAQ